MLGECRERWSGINLFSVGTAFRGRDLSSIDIRFWYLNLVPALKYFCIIRWKQHLVNVLCLPGHTRAYRIVILHWTVYVCRIHRVISEGDMAENTLHNVCLRWEIHCEDVSQWCTRERVVTQQTRAIHLMLFQCWPTVYDAGSTLKEHRVNAPCLLVHSDSWYNLTQCTWDPIPVWPWASVWDRGPSLDQCWVNCSTGK